MADLDLESVAAKMAPVVRELREAGLGDLEIATVIISAGVGFANQRGIDLATIRTAVNELIDASETVGSTSELVRQVVESRKRGPS